MTTLPDRAPKSSSAMFDAVRDRCRAMSLAVWRCDTGGTIISEPDEPGLAGLWLRSSKIGSLIATAARECSNHSSPQVRQLFEGCWVIPIVHENRRRRIGITLAVALAPASLDSKTFTETCTAA